jgi:hypothetical protein
MNAIKCAYCNKEITTPGSVDSCSTECFNELFERRFNSYPQRQDLTVDELFEYYVQSVLMVWAQEPQTAMDVAARQRVLFSIRQVTNNPQNQTSWGAVLREAGRRKFATQ